MDNNNLASFISKSHLRNNKTVPLENLILSAHKRKLPGANRTTSHLSDVLHELCRDLVADLSARQTSLMRLNPSRRDALINYLEELSGQKVPNGQQRLKNWLLSPKSSRQEEALHSYFYEVASIWLAQATLVKRWADREAQGWKKEDLVQLNWTLSRALKPFVPLGREGWHLTRPSLYSWYNPDRSIVEKIWLKLDQIDFKDVSADALISIIKEITSSRESYFDYDSRFYSALWKLSHRFGFNSKRVSDLAPKKTVFSPTMRDGSIMRSGPSDIRWAGAESRLFLLLLSELSHLWYGPSSPPLWICGDGLNLSLKEQLDLPVGQARFSTSSLLLELEAADLGFVFEDDGNTVDPKDLEKSPHLKKFCQAKTTIDELKALICLQKLRPGGQMIWARQNPLTSVSNTSLIQGLFDHAQLLLCFDFSGIECLMPAINPVFPKYLYLFKREADLLTRRQNTPTLIKIEGSLKSHVEAELLLEKALIHDEAYSSDDNRWRVHRFKSPTCQQDWVQNWPDSVKKETLEEFETLKKNSYYLGEICTVLPAPKSHPESKSHDFPPNLHAVQIYAKQKKGERNLVAERINSKNMIRPKSFLIYFQNKDLLEPVCRFLESKIIRDWLDCFGERKKDHWVFSHQTLKSLPIPKSLLEAVGSDNRVFSSEISSPQLFSFLDLVKDSNDNDSFKRAQIFVAAANEKARLLKSLRRLEDIVSHEGVIWHEILRVISPKESIPITMQPLLILKGKLPPETPIVSSKVIHKQEFSSVLLVTESGQNLTISSSENVLLEIVSRQIEALNHPTWREILSQVFVPRNLEVLKIAAADILSDHEVKQRRNEALTELLSVSCPKY